MDGLVGGRSGPEKDASAEEARAESAARANPGEGTSAPGEHRVRPAVAAPLRELLAYVWPAVALGPIGDALTPLVTQLVELRRGSPPSPGFGSPPSTLPTSASTDTEPRPSPSAAPRTVSSDPAPFYAAHGGGMSFLATVAAILASLVGLVALARLTVGEDLFTTRWLH